MMLHTKYQGSMPYGFSQKDFFKYFSLYKPIDVNSVSPGRGHFWHLAQNLNKLGIGPLDDATYQLSRL